MRVLDAVPMPKEFGDDSVVCFTGDIRDQALVRRALEGVKVVFHAAAIIELAQYAPAEVRERVHGVNVEGTRQLLLEAEAAGVERLVHTSSTAVVLDPGCGGGDESLPYSTSRDLYATTKIAAEKLVRGHRGKLLTCSLRPGGIYGPGERKQLVGLTFHGLGKGEPITIIGEGTSRLDYTHIDNLVDAQLRAADRLVDGSPVVGSAYFISDDEPVNHGEFTRRLTQALGMFPKVRYVPAKVLESVAYIAERRFERFGTRPMVTMGQVRTCVLDDYFSIAAARRELAYAPIYSTTTGIASMVSDLTTYLPEARFRGR